MPSLPYINDEIEDLVAAMESFEATPSIASTGTGSRREGEQFERLVGQLWRSGRRAAESVGAEVSIVKGVGVRRYAKMIVGPRTMYIPGLADEATSTGPSTPCRWLDVAFMVSDLVDAYPGQGEAISRYAPESGPFAGSLYPSMHAGLRTQFDDTVVLEETGVLREKILLEYKTAKSSRQQQVDGNAHERLSFQMMQYLEVATRYTRCSFMVMANGAFIRYRNKYHVSFHVQADRLSNFAWFSMCHASAAAEHARFVSGLLAWLVDGTPRNASEQQ